MRKLLLGTTALIGAAAIATVASAQEPLTVTVGGYLQFDAAHVSEDADSLQHSNDFRTSTEVHVKAEGTSDNGLTYGAVIELEADRSSDLGSASSIDNTTNGDENFIYVSGGFGKFELGDNDGVASVDGLSITAPSGFGLGGVVADEESYRDFVRNYPQTIAGDDVNSANVVNVLTTLFESPNSGNATKVTYYTPVWNGFQAGASYAPSQFSGNDTDRSDQVVGSTINFDSEFDNALEFGVKYAYDFGNDVGLGLSATYTRADALEFAGADHAEDLRSYGLGAQLTYAGFTLGGSYVNAGDSFIRVTETVDQDDTEGYTVGLQYETGPYVVGVNYLSAEAESDGDGTATTGGEAEYDAVSIGASYAAAPGWVAYAEYTDFSFEGDNTAITDADENDGSVFILGTRVSF